VSGRWREETRDIGLSNALPMPVIADGAETERERQFLMRERCREIQGYRVGGPQPIASHARHHERQDYRQACRSVGGVMLHSCFGAQHAAGTPVSSPAAPAPWARS